MKPRSPIKHRGRSRFPGRRDAPEGFLEFVRHEPCLVGKDCWHESRTSEDRIEWICDACHLKTRGSGGTDYGNVFPLCRKHHREQESTTQADFERKYGIDLARECRRIVEQWEDEWAA